MLYIQTSFKEIDKIPLKYGVVIMVPEKLSKKMATKLSKRKFLLSVFPRPVETTKNSTKVALKVLDNELKIIKKLKPKQILFTGDLNYFLYATFGWKTYKEYYGPLHKKLGDFCKKNKIKVIFKSEPKIDMAQKIVKFYKNKIFMGKGWESVSCSENWHSFYRLEKPQLGKKNYIISRGHLNYDQLWRLLE